MPGKNHNRSRVAPSEAALSATRWDQAVLTELRQLIQSGAGKKLPVVFDFDNTITRGDIGEATLAQLARSGRLTPATLPPALCPAFRPAGQERQDLQSFADIVQYYLALLAPTAHGNADPTPNATGYAWVIEVMAGLPLTEVVEAAREVLALSQSGKVAGIEVTPGRTTIPVPRFHPEVVELLAELIREDFDVWIVSASNVWSVRVAVLEALNPLLNLQAGAGIRADHVIGISSLLVDAEDRLYKDTLLVREDPGYASLARQATNRFKLTSRLSHPLPTYSGKVACILDTIGRRPYLGVGDSQGDRAMLSVSQHQLWIAPDPEERHRASARLVHSADDSGWPASKPLNASFPAATARGNPLPACSGNM